MKSKAVHLARRSRPNKQLDALEIASCQRARPAQSGLKSRCCPGSANSLIRRKNDGNDRRLECYPVLGAICRLSCQLWGGFEDMKGITCTWFNSHKMLIDTCWIEWLQVCFLDMKKPNYGKVVSQAGDNHFMKHSIAARYRNPPETGSLYFEWTGNNIYHEYSASWFHTHQDHGVADIFQCCG